jgi:hypothetical protein
MVIACSESGYLQKNTFPNECYGTQSATGHMPPLNAKSTVDVRVQGVEIFSQSRGPKADKAIQRWNFERFGFICDEEDAQYRLPQA